MKMDMHPAPYRRCVMIPLAMQSVGGIKAEDFDKRFPGMILNARVRAESVIHILYQEAGPERELPYIAVREASLPRPATYAIVSEFKAELAVLDDSPDRPLVCQNTHYCATCPF
jgi:hypothetical protein